MAGFTTPDEFMQQLRSRGEDWHAVFNPSDPRTFNLERLHNVFSDNAWTFCAQLQSAVTVASGFSLQILGS